MALLARLAESAVFWYVLCLVLIGIGSYALSGSK